MPRTRQGLLGTALFRAAGSWRLAKTEYVWRLMAVTSGGVTLHCLHTNHKIILGADSVREFQTPHFLLLWCQLILDGDGVHIEPIT